MLNSNLKAAEIPYPTDSTIQFNADLMLTQIYISILSQLYGNAIIALADYFLAWPHDHDLFITKYIYCIRIHARDSMS